MRVIHSYLSFRPDELSSQQDAIIAKQNCIKDIRLWVEHNKLLLNDEKTEFLIIGTRQFVLSTSRLSAEDKPQKTVFRGGFSRKILKQLSNIGGSPPR